MDHQNPYANVPEDNEEIILDTTNISSGIVTTPMTEEEEEELEIAIRNSYWRDSKSDKATFSGLDLASGSDISAVLVMNNAQMSTIKCPQAEFKRKQRKIDITRLKQAEAESHNSNCQKHMVGCIITDVDGRILSSGYNGTPAGHQNCCDKFPNYDKVFGGDVDVDRHTMEVMVREHREWSMQHEIHAEVNALLNSDPIKRRGGTLYVNLQPCENCAKMIAGSGLARVVFGKAYHRANNEVSEKLFAASGIEYIHLKDVIDYEIPSI